MDVIETVEEHCQHPDCYYRMKLDDSCHYCGYCIVEYQLRGCKISECTRYKRGKKKPTIDGGTLWFRWELFDD